jgi:hypothetical protein
MLVNAVEQLLELREPLNIMIKCKTINSPKTDNILKIYFDVLTIVIRRYTHDDYGLGETSK